MNAHVLVFFGVIAVCYAQSKEAYARINNGRIKGKIIFKEKNNGRVEIKGIIGGLVPLSVHGFHIHEGANVQDNCKNIGRHFDPVGKMDHGEHAGDFENIVANEVGVVKFKLTVDDISLSGKYSVVGHSIGIDADEDKYDGQEQSTIACGTIMKGEYKHKDDKKFIGKSTKFLVKEASY